MARLIVNFPPGRAYDHDDDGWIALIEEKDIDRVITEIWSDWKLADVAWEGISYRDGFLQAIYLADNEKGFVIVIPYAPWFSDKLRESIEFNRDTRPQAQQAPAMTRLALGTAMSPKSIIILAICIFVLLKPTLG